MSAVKCICDPTLPFTGPSCSEFDPNSSAATGSADANSSASLGLVVGAAVGGVVLLAILAVVVVVARSKRAIGAPKIEPSGPNPWYIENRTNPAFALGGDSVPLNGLVDGYLEPLRGDGYEVLAPTKAEPNPYADVGPGGDGGVYDNVGMDEVSYAVAPGKQLGESPYDLGSSAAQRESHYDFASVSKEPHYDFGNTSKSKSANKHYALASSSSAEPKYDFGSAMRDSYYDYASESAGASGHYALASKDAKPQYDLAKSRDGKHDDLYAHATSERPYDLGKSARDEPHYALASPGPSNVAPREEPHYAFASPGPSLASASAPGRGATRVDATYDNVTNDYLVVDSDTVL